jgi:hypothetical protein
MKLRVRLDAIAGQSFCRIEAVDPPALTCENTASARSLFRRGASIRCGSV